MLTFFVLYVKLKLAKKFQKDVLTLNEILKEIGLIGIVPVVKIDNAEDAVPLAKALISGGLPCAEITFRTAAAEQAIKNIAEQCPEMLVGAGTVLTKEQADAAIKAGAKFLVSPGLNPKIVSYCKEKGYLILPGTANPSDVEQALELGLDTVKFFPAEAAGGLPMIKAMSAPYGSLKFMPTGGINAKNVKEYLEFSKIIACGGSWMVPGDLITSGNFDEIERLTAEAVKVMLDFKVVHIGINSADETASKNAATTFENLFGFTSKEGNKSYFCSDMLEVMKMNGAGTKGHLAVGTASVPRAYAYLKRNGVEFNEETALYDEKGNLKFIYLKEEIGGFAVHLVKNK